MATYTIPLKGDITENWVASNRVLEMNEVGIEHDTSGGVNLKVGDGVTGWNMLGYASRSFKNVIITGSELTVTLNADKNIMCQEVTRLSILEPTDIYAGYLCFVSFTSGDNPTNFNAPWISLFSGDDCVDNVFQPITNTRYNIAIQHDGAYITGLVAGFKVPVEDEGDETSNNNNTDNDSTTDDSTENNDGTDSPGTDSVNDDTTEEPANNPVESVEE